MLKFLKKKVLGSLGQNDLDDQARDNLAKAASVSAMERRAHIRISLPEFVPLNIIPNLSYQGKRLALNNISLGGIQLIESQFKAALVPGEFYEFEFDWNDTSDKFFQRAKLLRKVGNQYHFKFDDLATDLIVRCSIAFKAGERGKRMTPVAKAELPKDHGKIIDMWANPFGDYIMTFEHEGNEMWEIQFSNKKYHVGVNAPLKASQGQEVLDLVREDLILFTFNVNETDPKLIHLISLLSRKS